MASNLTSSREEERRSDKYEVSQPDALGSRSEWLEGPGPVTWVPAGEAPGCQEPGQSQRHWLLQVPTCPGLKISFILWCWELRKAFQIT